MIRAATPIDPRRIPVGLQVEVSGDTAETRAHEVRFFVGLDRIVRVNRQQVDSIETWTVSDERLQWNVDTLIVRGVVKSSLYEAVEAGATRPAAGACTTGTRLEHRRHLRIPDRHVPRAAGGG